MQSLPEIARPASVSGTGTHFIYACGSKMFNMFNDMFEDMFEQFSAEMGMAFPGMPGMPKVRSFVCSWSLGSSSVASQTFVRKSPGHDDQDRD